jgi:hypothetical protein
MLMLEDAVKIALENTTKSRLQRMILNKSNYWERSGNAECYPQPPQSHKITTLQKLHRKPALMGNHHQFAW